MTRIFTRLVLTFCTPLVCSLGALSGCGQDEFVAPPPAPDAGDTEGPRPGPTTTSPTTTPTTNPTVSPVSPVTPGANSMLGASCARNNDCGSGLFCLLPSSDDWLGGGAPNGYCTADCSSGGDPQCEAIDANSFCIGVSETVGYCVSTCSAGGTATKCQGRPDVACDAFTLETSGLAFCRPMCRGDEDCGSRKCDMGNGACYDELLEGDSFGATCNPEAATSSCSSGLCLGGATEGTADVGFCSGYCTVGEECASADGVVSAGGGFCLNASDLTGPGDMGLCYQVCDCDADCGADKFSCARVPNVLENLGVQGFCVEFDAEFSAESGIEVGIECQSTDSGTDPMTPLDGAVDAVAPTSDSTSGFDAQVPGSSVSPDAAPDAN